MTPAALLTDALDRSLEVATNAVAGLSVEELTWRPDAEANSVSWLVWHLTRVQDDHVATVAGSSQVWLAEGWASRAGLPFEVADIGFGHEPQDVARVRLDADFLTEYLTAVHRRSTTWLTGVTEADLDRVVDERWVPPVTLGVRLVSVADECAQHAGQAAYLRGLLDRR